MFRQEREREIYYPINPNVNRFVLFLCAARSVMLSSCERERVEIKYSKPPSCAVYYS